MIHGLNPSSVALLALPLLVPAATADDLRHSYTSRAAFAESETGSGDIDTVVFANTLTSEGQFSVGNNWQLYSRLTLRHEARDRLEPGEPDDGAVRSQLSRRTFLNVNTDIELREFYLDGYVGDTFFRLGKQQVVWGQADGLRVLDVINPMNLREFILEDSEQRRIPTWMINAEVPVQSWTAQLLWIPDTTYDQVPSIREQALFAPSSPRFVPDITATTQISLAEPHKPNRLVSDSDAGLRLTTFASGWDISVAYLYHYLDRPALYRQWRDDSLTLRPRYHRSHLVGATFSSAISDFTLRGEIALDSDRYFITDNATRADSGIANSWLASGVVGLDYTGLSDTLISAQLFVSSLGDYDERAVRDRTETTATLLIQRELLHRTLTLESLWLHNLNVDDGLLRLGFDYQWRSRLSFGVGLDVFYGKEAGVFGQFSSQDRLWLEVNVDL